MRSGLTETKHQGSSRTPPTSNFEYYFFTSFPPYVSRNSL